MGRSNKQPAPKSSVQSGGRALLHLRFPRSFRSIDPQLMHPTHTQHRAPVRLPQLLIVMVFGFGWAGPNGAAGSGSDVDQSALSFEDANSASSSPHKPGT